MAFAFGWNAMLPLLLSESGPFGVVPIELPWQPFAAIMSVFGLTLPVFLVTADTSGRDGVRDLLCRILRWRVGGACYITTSPWKTVYHYFRTWRSDSI